MELPVARIDRRIHSEYTGPYPIETSTSTFDVIPSSSQLQLFLFDKRFDPTALGEIVRWKRVTC